MELHRIESNLSRDERVKLNENFDTIDNNFSDVNAKISSLATGEDLSDLQAEIQNLSYVGEWDANTYYHKHNAVTVDGSSYRALVDNNGVYVSNTDTWVLVAQKGDPFTYEDFTSNQLESLRGPQGPKGETGDAVEGKSIKRENLLDEVTVGIAESINSESAADYSYAITDLYGRLSEFILNLEGKVPANVLQAWRTRMGLANVISTDSQITTEMAQYLKSSIGVLTDEIPVDENINEILWGIVDSNNRVSEILIDYEGKVPQWILDKWKNRMGISNSGGNSGEIVAWGDSLTAGGGTSTSYISEVGRLSGRTVYNYGVGGESSSTIVSRQGGLIMMLNNITIPASATERVQVANYNNRLVDNTGRNVTPLRQGTAGINPCYIKGVKGTLSVSQTSSTSEDYVLYFQRETNGDSIVINRPTPIITNGSINRRNDIMVIFIGQNGGYTDNNELISQIRAMIDFNTSTRKEYIVLGLTSGTATSRADLEKAMTLEFGRRYINLRSYLSTYGMDDLGLTPTTQDITAMASGSVPPSMLTDAVHHTEGTRILIGRLIYERMVELNIL